MPPTAQEPHTEDYILVNNQETTHRAVQSPIVKESSHPSSSIDHDRSQSRKDSLDNPNQRGDEVPSSYQGSKSRNRLQRAGSLTNKKRPNEVRASGGIPTHSTAQDQPGAIQKMKQVLTSYKAPSNTEPRPTEREELESLRLVVKEWQSCAKLLELRNRALKAQAEQETAKIKALENRVSIDKQEINDLVSMVSNLEKQLSIAQHDLSTSRAFVSSEGTRDAQSLVDDLELLNKAIDDFAFQLSHLIPQDVVNRPLNKATLQKTLQASPFSVDLHSFAKIFLKTGGNIGDFLIPFVQYSLCKQLVDVVFSPFVPGQSEVNSSILIKLHKIVSQNEPQERSARWRSITCSHANGLEHSRDDQFWEKIAEVFLNMVVTSLKPMLSPHIFLESNLKAKHGDSLMSILQASEQFQNKVKTLYLSYDYSVVFYTGDCVFKGEMMKSPNPRKNKGKIPATSVLTTAFGLKASRTTGTEGKYNRESTVVEKAVVLTDLWTPDT